jgi:hypothetical protein
MDDGADAACVRFAPFVLSPPLLAPVAPAAHRQRVRGMARLVLRAVDHDPVGSPVSTTTSPFTLAFAHLQIVFQRAERRRGDARWQGARGHEPSLEGTPSRPKERRTLPAPRPADAAGELLFSTPPLVAPILFRLTAHRRRRAFSPGHLNEHAVSSSDFWVSSGENDLSAEVTGAFPFSSKLHPVLP